MPDIVIDPPPGFRAELTAALSVLAPQIDGLGDLAAASISADAKTVVTDTLAAKNHRQDLINAVIAAMNDVVFVWANLTADGYPATPLVATAPDVFVALQSETNAIDTAMKIFVESGVAISVDTTDAVHTPQDVPVQP